ncbi:MAG: hypothetical protein CMF48_03445 [Legionellales bacterium]|nr:hypothetical protein [Legionellales bacterium]|tara:strand:+ start:120 stop:833 length:714 start_codon:yes stop_codon:yes gene_type:complete
MTTLIIIRGLPGSGKYPIVEQLVRDFREKNPTLLEPAVVRPADCVFGKKLTRESLGLAHLTAHYHTAALMMQKHPLIIVNATNIHIADMLPYVNHAVTYGYRLELVEAKLDVPKDKELVSLQENARINVSIEKLQLMRSQWEPASAADLLGIVHLERAGQKAAMNAALRRSSGARSYAHTTSEPPAQPPLPRNFLPHSRTILTRPSRGKAARSSSTTPYARVPRRPLVKPHSALKRK